MLYYLQQEVVALKATKSTTLIPDFGLWLPTITEAVITHVGCPIIIANLTIFAAIKHFAKLATVVATNCIALMKTVIVTVATTVIATVIVVSTKSAATATTTTVVTTTIKATIINL